MRGSCALPRSFIAICYIYINAAITALPVLPIAVERSLIQQTGAQLTSQESALKETPTVFVAVSRDYYDLLPLELLVGKTVIDVSNNTKKRKGPEIMSNAEYLQKLLPESYIVKGFNVLSAYSLESGGLQASKEVFLASNYDNPKAAVSSLVRSMGFTPIDWGVLKAARDIEDIPLQLMPSWKRPVAVVFGIFLFHWIFAFFQFQICTNLAYKTWSHGWKHLGMENFNRVLGICALWVLSFCYLPGVIAAYIQLFRGTKYTRFPKWLDDWLKMRKQLGLLMLGMACMHACISVAILTPQTVEWVYEKPTKVTFDVSMNVSKTITMYNFELNWRGELFLTLGAVATCLVVVLGISSLPSVTATLSWREFTFIQSKLGWVALIAASFHDIFLAWNFMFLYWGCFNTVPIGPQYALYPPIICVVLKIPLLLPCIDRYLKKIRNGFESKKQRTKDMS